MIRLFDATLFRMKLLLILFALFSPVFWPATALLAATSTGTESAPTWESWWKAQASLQTWEAEFTQTRRLAGLSRTLQTVGHLWFQSPRSFRWELGKPAETIAVRESGTIWVIYPKLRRVERYPVDGGGRGAFSEASALFEAGLPKSRAELETSFTEVGRFTTNGCHVLALAPRSTRLKRILTRIEIAIPQAGEPVLKWTEMQLRDGSVLRNEFKEPRTNQPVSAGLFAAPSLDGMEVVDPFRQTTRKP